MVQAEIAHDRDVVRLFSSIDRQFGVLNALVNNAGIVGMAMPIGEIDTNMISAVRAAAASIPIGRISADSAVAAATVWFASDEASYVNGANLAPWGGHSEMHSCCSSQLSGIRSGELSYAG